MLLRALSLLLLLLPPGAALAAVPSFDCAKAATEAEQAVCAEENLAALDRELSRLYDLALNGPHASPESAKELRAYQRGWVKGRNACWKDGEAANDCVAESYVLRIHELREGYMDARAADEVGASLGPLAYACDGLDAGLSAVFVNVGEARFASLKWRQNAVVLSQAIAASGARYTGKNYAGEHEFWTKGREASLTLPDRGPLQCQVDATG